MGNVCLSFKRCIFKSVLINFDKKWYFTSSMFFLVNIMLWLLSILHHYAPCCVCNVHLKFRSISLWFILWHVNALPGNGLVSKFPRRQILGKQSFGRLCNNRGVSLNIHMVQHATINEAVFSMSSAPSSGGTTEFWNPFLSNGSVNIFPHKKWRHITVDRNHVTCFLCGPCRGYITKFSELLWLPAGEWQN
jgi:hypothetical protein